MGRLEGMGRARDQVWKRERGEMERMERERRRVEGEVGELVRRVEVLVDEVRSYLSSLLRPHLAPVLIVCHPLSNRLSSRND